MADVFISYSRRDRVFVRRLYDSLTASGRDVWIDWEDIPYSVEWWAEICRGIDAADNVLFIISPHSLASSICHDELTYAQSQNKRIVPIIRRSVNAEHSGADQAWEAQARSNWEYLSKLNWLFFRKQPEATDCTFDEAGKPLDPDCDSARVDLDDFDRQIAALLDTIRRDDIQVRRHTRYRLRAQEWEATPQNLSLLLRGDDLAVAQQWLRESEGKTPEPTPLHRRFIEESVVDEARRLAEEQRRIADLNAATRRATRARQTLAGSVVTAVMIIGLTVFASARTIEQRTFEAGQTVTPFPITVAAFSTEIKQRAEQVSQIESERLAALANRQLDVNGNPESAALLAIRGLRSAYQHVTFQALLGSLSRLHTRQQFPASDQAAALSPDGQQVLTGHEQAANLYDVETGALVRTFEGHSAPVTQVAFVGTEWVATGSGDSVRIFERTTGKLRHTYQAAEVTFLALESTADGTVLALLTDAKQVILLDSDTGQVKAEKRAFGTPTRGVFSADGRLLALAISSRVELWDAQTLEVQWRFSDETSEAVQGIAFSADELTVYALLADRTLVKLNVLSGTATRKALDFGPTWAQLTVVAVDLQPEGRGIDRFFVLSLSDGGLYRWDDVMNSLAPLQGHLGQVRRVRFGRDKNYVITVAEDGTARLWAVHPVFAQRQITLPDNVDALAISPDGKRLLTIDIEKRFTLWDAVTLASLRRVTLDASVSALAFSPDNKRFALAANDGTVRLIDVERGEELSRFSVDGPQAIQFSPTGDSLLIASQTPIDVQLWRTDGTLLRSLAVGGNTLSINVNGVFSPDGSVVATSDGFTIRLLDASTGHQRLEINNQGATITEKAILDFSPDGKLLLSVADGTVYLWDVATGEKQREIPTLTDTIMGAAISADGQMLAIGASDEQVTLINLADGRRLAAFVAHDFWVAHVVATDGWLITGGGKFINWWSVDFGVWLHGACNRVFRDLTERERGEYNVLDRAPSCPPPVAR